MRKLCQLFKEAWSFTLSVGGSGQRFLNSAGEKFLRAGVNLSSPAYCGDGEGRKGSSRAVWKEVSLCLPGFLASWSKGGSPSLVSASLFEASLLSPDSGSSTFHGTHGKTNICLNALKDCPAEH